MSSIKSSPLALELTPHWATVGAFLGWFALLTAGMWRSTVPAGACALFTSMLLMAGLPVLRSQLFRVCSRALKTLVLQPDGRWLLIDGRGMSWTAELSPASRCIPECGLLIWRSHGRPWALLGRAAADPAALRRLRVRLRFS